MDRSGEGRAGLDARSFVAVLSAVFLAFAFIGALTLVELWRGYADMPPGASGADFLGLVIFGPISAALTALAVPAVCGFLLVHRVTKARLAANRVVAAIMWALYALFVARTLYISAVGVGACSAGAMLALFLSTAIAPALYTVAVQRVSRTFERPPKRASRREDSAKQ